MKRDVGQSDEEGVKTKELAILDLGSLLAETHQGEGILTKFSPSDIIP